MTPEAEAEAEAEVTLKSDPPLGLDTFPERNNRTRLVAHGGSK
jgi:hypothetical protein